MKEDKLQEIKALVNLVDDPDELIYNQIKSKIISMGKEVIPMLESAWEFKQEFGDLFVKRIENIIHTIQFKEVYSLLENWINKGGKDLLEAAIIISKFQYPDLEEDKIHSQIELIEKDVWLELNNQLTALEKVRVINHILFDIHKFKGDKDDYHNPHNSFIKDVLETKKGNPISLSILYSIIAQKHQIPLYGINLPKHFILAYLDIGPYQLSDLNKNPSVLFYVNPFSRGSVFSKKEIDDFLKEIEIDPQAHFYFPCSNFDIVKRMIHNLQYSYSLTNKVEKIEELKQLLELLKNTNT